MTKQYTEDDIRRMTPEQIVAAHDAGQFDDLTGASRYPSTGQLTAQHAGQMTEAEFKQAYSEGRFDQALGKSKR